VRLVYLFAASWIAAPILAAQAPALLRTDVTQATNCLGTADVTSSPAERSRDVLIVMWSGSWEEAEANGARQEITSFYQAVNRSNPIRLLLLAGENPRFAGPFKSRTELQAALRDFAAIAQGQVAPSPLAFYTMLGGSAQWGSGWSTVVLAGHPPVLAPDVAPYTEAWLSMRLRHEKVQVSSWPVSGETSELLDGVARATGGMSLPEGLAPLIADLKSNPALREVAWTDPVPNAGFRVCPVSLATNEGQPAVVVPSIAVAVGEVLPEPGRYAILREKTQALAATLQSPQLSDEQGSQAESNLRAALEIGPHQEDLLRLAVTLYQRRRNDLKLAAALAALTGIVPNDAGLFADLGHARFRLADWDAAGRALLRARELRPGDAAVSEELARIRLNQKDDPAALPFLEETLALQADRQDLWLLRADVAARLGDWQRTADSVEHAVALGSVALERRTALVRLYIEHQQVDRALIHVRAVAASLPLDAAVRSEYAGFLETLHQPDEALQAWSRVLEADPKLELAHHRIVRILFGKNLLPAALEAAGRGIEAAPQSPRLYLDKAEVLDKQDRFYEARRTLREAARTVADPSLIERLAVMEDAGGQNAARYYRQLVEGGRDTRAEILERGLAAALRDGDLEDAAWFRAREPDGGKGGVSQRMTNDATMRIPGGLAALSFVAHSRLSAPERFLVEYARTVAQNLSIPDKKAVEAYSENIREHFHRIAALSALGTARDGVITVTIAPQDKRQQKNADRILELLGWKMRISPQEVKLEAAEKGDRAKHQETASALGLDEIGMQQVLERGKSFSFDIPAENARVVLGEPAWKAQFRYTGTLPEAIAGDLRLAQTYAALGQMEPTTAAALASAVGLKSLSENHAPILFQFSSALAIDRGRVSVPGGPAADPIWTALTGASPTQPALFFRALLAKDDGKLLAFYSALSDLDLQHQQFFTRTSSRTTRFYELFRDAPEMQRANSRHIPSGSFVEFLAEVPLNEDGSVDFPGSPEVWTVAKGQSHSTGNVAKMVRKLKRKAAPEVEDEILLRLARTRYKQAAQAHSELDNFLAVVRVDQHRSDPLDEGSALLLAQHYADDGPAYAWFATLTGLEQKQFEPFFALTDALYSRSDEEKNAALGLINPLIEMVCLAQEAGTLSEAQSAGLFGQVVEAFQNATSPAAQTAAALDTVRAILRAGKNDSADLDAALRNLLLASYPATDIDLGGTTLKLDPSKARHQRFQHLLEAQRIPALATVVALSDAARNLGAGKGAAAEQIRVLESKAAGLFPPDIPKDLGLTAKEKEQVAGFQPRRLEDLVKQFREKTDRKKGNPKDLEKLAQDYLAEMNAPVRWALTGAVYAYFLNPDDLLVSEDPLLVRKHQFVTPEPGHKTEVWGHADLQQSSKKAGSYLTGGFADFGDAAGRAAVLSANLGGMYGEYAAGKQISALRMTNWGKLRDEDLRLVGLKITVAREWLVRAASQPEIQAALSESLLGLLSLTRRAGLLAALGSEDWTSVWSLVSLSDLYFLADRYLERYPADPWDSPATRALRRLAIRNDGARLQVLGAELTDILGCSHPHLQAVAPYEQYERDLFPARLAERSAEFKLYLVRYADAAGIPASALGAIAEPTARAALQTLQMSDIHDWRSVLAVWGTIDTKRTQEALSR
jgi:tetratricopeptide (TPR) repeat protein